MNNIITAFFNRLNLWGKMFSTMILYSTNKLLNTVKGAPECVDMDQYVQIINKAYYSKCLKVEDGHFETLKKGEINEKEGY